MTHSAIIFVKQQYKPNMKHISVIVPANNAIISSVVGPYKIFQKVNQFLIESDQTTSIPFQVELVGLSKKSLFYDSIFEINPHKTIEEVTKTDLIFIPAFHHSPLEAIEENKDYIPWIKEQHNQGAEVASLCVGAFILASTGIVNQKSCTTHWMAVDLFRNLFPEVNLLPEKVITDEQGIYTSGGAYSFLNLIIYMVEKYAGREIAIWASKLFEIEIDRFNQSHFAIFNGQKSHDDEAIFNAQEYIETNFSQKISVEQLAEMFALSRRNFIRRFKKATSNTPIEYIQRVKIEAAKKSLESTQQNVNEVMYAIGYSDSKAFRNVFKKYTGFSPVEYRNKYNRALSSI